MKNTLKYLSLLAISVLSVYGIAQASTTLPTSVPALFETYLSAQQSTSDTSLSLANVTLKDGTALSGYQCVVIDSNSPSVEYECGTASSTQLTSLLRGIDPVTGTSSVTALKYAHRLGADVKVSDYPVLTLLTRILNGLDFFPNKLSYATTTTPTNANDISPKSYVDSVVSSATSTIGTSFLNLTSNSQTVSGTNTFSGVQTFSAKPVFSVGATGITPVSTTDVAIKSYVDGVAIAGGATSTNSITGIGRTANASNISSGYSSNVPYFIPSSLASSTASTTSSIVVVTNASTGKIDNSFLSSTGSPAGTIDAYASSTPPTGWLNADGSSVSTTTYSALFAVIGYTFGGAGANFNLPNLTGRTIVMASSTQATTTQSTNRSTIGATGGEVAHTQLSTELAPHTHTASWNSTNSGGSTQGWITGSYTSGGQTLTTSSAGSGVAMNVLDPYIILNYIIKY